MRICRTSIKRNHNTPATKQLSRQLVTTATKPFGKQGVVTFARNGTFAAKAATGLIGERLCRPKNSLRGEAVLVAQKPIGGGRRRTLREWLSLRHGGMREKRAQRVSTLLKSGMNLKRDMIIDALIVRSEGHSHKTILFLYQKVARIISQTFNPSAVIAIAKSGRTARNYFNIHENPGLQEV